MIGFILLIILCGGFWTLFGISLKKDKDWLTVVGIIFGLITTLLTIASTVHIVLRPLEADSFRIDKEYKQELVYAISDNMSPRTISSIITSATYHNERIEKNKKHCDSKMWGFLYNKGIAETEPIDIPEIKIKIIKTEYGQSN